NQLMVREGQQSLLPNDMLRKLFVLLGFQSVDEIVTVNSSINSNKTVQFSKTFLDTLSIIVKNEQELISLANRILNSFPNIQTAALTNEQFTSLKKVIIDQLLVQLPASSKEFIAHLLDENTR